jgi:hypothetical protein
MTDRGSTVGLSLVFVLAGVMSLIAGVGLIIAFPEVLATYHYNQRVISVTHLLVLGFMGSVVMGALYQLVPVALETRLHSVGLGWAHAVCHLVGFAGMTVTFWKWDLPAVGMFGSLFAVGVGVFAFNLFRTLRNVPRWSVIATAVVSVLAWLVLTVLAGLYLAASKCWSFSPFHPIAAMHAHAHMGGAGVFLMLIVGIAYKLVPMFVLGELQNPRRAAWSVVIINGGLVGLAMALVLESSWKLLFAVVILVGLALFGFEIRAILRCRQRRRLDWGMRQFLTALGIVLPLSLLAVVLCWPTLPVTEFTAQLENVYGLTAVLGMFAFAIVGMLHKIVPFLVWYRCYGPKIGREPVPALGQMHSERLQVISFGLCLAGLGGLAIATAFGHLHAVRWTACLYGFGIAAFAFSIGLILDHFRLSNPQFSPGKRQTPWNRPLTSRPQSKSTASSAASSIPSLG